MKWKEIKITTTSDAADAIAEKMMILGAYGISIEDPSEIAGIINSPNSLSYADEGYIESLGEEVIVKAYFAEHSQGVITGTNSYEDNIFTPTDKLYFIAKDRKFLSEEFLEIVKKSIYEVSSFLDIGTGLISTKYVADEDWQNCWKKYFHPEKISERVVIAPTWEEYIPCENEIVVLIDPGSAFGTGGHATTAMCATLLDDEMSKRENANVSVLDLGCGSGILSAIAAKMGARVVDAVDIDEIAVNVAKENCRVNDVSNTVNCERGEAFNILNKEYDIICANIIADVIEMIAPEIKRLLKNDGVFITSGIINTKKEKVLHRYLDIGFELIKEIEKDEWISYLFRIKDNDYKDNEL